MNGFIHDSLVRFDRVVPISRWNPRSWGFGSDDELIKLIEDDIFSYARKNLALINVYIKVRGLYLPLAADSC